MTRILFLSLLLALGVFPSAHAIVFPWPKALKHPRVMLYADQDIEDYIRDHPDWFKDDFIIAGLYIDNVAYGDSDKATNLFKSLYARLRAKNITPGTYISGTTVLHELSLTKYPANAVSMEDMSLKAHYLGPWARQPGQMAVDLSDNLSRKSLDMEIVTLWRQVPTVMRFVDDAAVHPRVAQMQPWEAYCRNIRELRSIAEALHGNAVFNVIARVWEMSDSETKMLIDAVAGNGSNAVSFPLPWSKSLKEDKKASAWAIYRYRQLLDHRVVVILIPSDDAPEDALFEWIDTWRKPTDRIYVAIPYWEIPPSPIE